MSRWLCVRGRRRNGSAYLIVPACPPSLPAFPTWSRTCTRSLQNLHRRHVRSSRFSRSIEVPAIHEPPCWSAHAPSLTKGCLTGVIVFHSCAWNRSENCVLLGPVDEVVSRHRWSEGFEPTGRQTEHLSEHGWAVSIIRSVGHAKRCAFISETALAATGFIWVRYSLVITPVNYSLAAVRLPGRLLEMVRSAHLVYSWRRSISLSGLPASGS